jgi:hypothetical protein
MCSGDKMPSECPLNVGFTLMQRLERHDAAAGVVPSKNLPLSSSNVTLFSVLYAAYKEQEEQRSNSKVCVFAKRAYP